MKFQISKTLFMLLRKLMFYSLTILSSLMKFLTNRTSDKKERKVYLYPSFACGQQLADYLNKALWYLPSTERGLIKLCVPVEPNLRQLELSKITPSSEFENYLEGVDMSNILLVDKLDLADADRILCWNWKYQLSLSGLRGLGKLDCIDSLYFGAFESETFKGVFDNLSYGNVSETLDNISKSNFRKFANQVRGYDNAFVFCTGPSISEAINWNYESGVRIVCNSIVKNRKLMDHIKPHVLAFADPVFHFSPCKYASLFRDQMVEAVEKYNCFIAVPSQTVSFLISHYPSLKNRIIGMKGVGRTKLLSEGRFSSLLCYRRINKFNFPSPENLFIKNTHNITTSYMLPIVSAVAKCIYVIGADGRKPEEKYFWKHNSSTQYDELMQTVFDAHPSFFRDRSYADYYAQYCQEMEELFKKGESEGKKYYSLTNSYTPALAKRRSDVIK